MAQPIESLDRPSLERRYRRMRLATAILGAVSILLAIALGTQSMRGTVETAAPASTTQGTSPSAAAGGEVSTDNDAAQQCPVVDRRIDDDPRALGDIDAPIVLHEWTDFRCPYCGAFSRDTLPVLIEEYVDTGKVRLEIHDAALVGGENSVLIAAAARAAGDEGRYFEFYDAVYLEMEAQGENRVEFDLDLLVRLAEQSGVADISAFKSTVESGVHETAVRAETADAQQIGVTGVPFFATTGCGQVMSGAQTIETFRAMLDATVEAANEANSAG